MRGLRRRSRSSTGSLWVSVRCCARPCHPSSSAVSPDGVSFTSRFVTGTPPSPVASELLSSVRRAWSVAPTSERIAEDILTPPLVLKKITEAKGIALQDGVLRHDRRLGCYGPMKKNAKPLKHRPRAHQRKGTTKSGIPQPPTCRWRAHDHPGFNQWAASTTSRVSCRFPDGGPRRCVLAQLWPIS